MTTELIVNVTSQETRVALKEDGVVTEIQIERQKDRSIVGNIYKGKVVKVLPGIQSAFVDIGEDRTAFLHVKDIVCDYDKLEADSVDFSGIQASDSAEPLTSGYTPPDLPKSIEELITEGQELLVHVSKEPLGKKGARLTTQITLPGRYLVLMPNLNQIGISRRINDEKEKKRLKEICHRLKPDNLGMIARTACQDRDEEELRNELDFLTRLWSDIQKKAIVSPTPSLIHEDLNIILRCIRDLYPKELSKIIIDSKEAYDNVLAFIDTFIPSLRDSLLLYEGNEPIFDYHEIEIEISRALENKIWLKSGGFIVIEATEALTAIDVNTGRFVGRRNLEETLLKTNLEAAKEICYQLRLRNIGGVIIIDFIDMKKDSSKEKVFRTLKEEILKKDKAKSSILKISELGLVEMTRERAKENLRSALCEPCSFCGGNGFVRSKTTVLYEVLREIKAEISRLGEGGKILVLVHPDVADLLYEEERQTIERLENRFKRKIIIKAKGSLNQEEFDIIRR